METVESIRHQFSMLYKHGQFVPDRTGQMTVEVLGAQFIADDDTIFGRPNAGYITKEIGWYMSRSLNINDMEQPIPTIWKLAAGKDGRVNSNYGYLVFDPENHSQADNCIVELRNNQWSRRAVMIYTRPSMWVEYNADGMSDFMCTNAVQYFIRESPNEPGLLRLFCKVDMRSNDAWAGYRNDYAWQVFIFNYMHSALQRTYSGLKRGAIIWNVGSLHVYERNFDLIQHYIDTGNHIPSPEELMVTRKSLVEKGVIREKENDSQSVG